MPAFMRGHWKAVVFAAAALFSAVCQAVPPGTVIDNTARATFDVGASAGLTADSNTVSVTSAVIRTASTLMLLQYRPSAPTVSARAPAGCRNGAGGSFAVSPAPQVPAPGTGFSVLDPLQPLDLAPGNLYHAGEPVFVQVEDNDQNLDAAAAETVVVAVSASGGDAEEIRLTETDVDTGVFIGYIQTGGAAAAPFDCLLSVGPETVIEAGYTDPADNGDTAAAASLVDPFGTVFDSLSGEPVDNAVVRLVNAATGRPAQPGVEVFGNDGVSAFPNTLVTGTEATDAGGTLYNFPEGGYRFPLVAPGDYRLEIVSVPGYLAPSDARIADLQRLPGAPFALFDDASYGRRFALQAGPPMHVDIPVDPTAAELVVEKTALVGEAAVGDFVQYRVTVENVSTFADAYDVLVIDALPQGLRYQRGSARLQGAALADPQIDGRGAELRFAGGNLAPGESLSLTYVVEVTAGTPLGKAVNSARATDARGATSNVARSVIEVRDELMRERNILFGRVIAGNCPVAAEEPGRADVRLQSSRHGDVVEYKVDFAVDDARIADYRLTVDLPEALSYVPGSVRLDGHRHGEPDISAGALGFDFDNRRFADVSRWGHTLTFRARVEHQAYGRFTTGARASMRTAGNTPYTTPVARNILLRQPPGAEEKHFVFQPVVPTEGGRLTEAGRAELERIVEMVGEAEVVKVNIRDAGRFDSHLDLERSRARLVAPYFQSALKLDGSQVALESTPGGAGSDEAGAASDPWVGVAVDMHMRWREGVDKVILADSGTVGVDLAAVTEERRAPSVGGELEGLEGVRVYMEDGTYAVTDKEGKFHIEGVRPGTHVVQLDLESLPEGVRVVECERNTRFAGSVHSQFVDLKPGSLWRVDFHVEEEPAPYSHAEVQMFTDIRGGELHYRINNRGGEFPVDNYRITVVLPEGVDYLSGSSRFNGEPVKDPQGSGNILVYRLGDLPAEWDKPLTFEARIGPGVEGELVSKAAVMFDTGKDKGIRVPPVETAALIENRRYEPRHYVLQPRFEPLGAELSEPDRRRLEAMLPELRSTRIRQVRVIGHTDNRPISAEGRRLYRDNHELSRARAESVAEYLRAHLSLAPGAVIAEGRGADEPVASNDTAEGRARNRRTEIVIDAVQDRGPDVAAMVREQSEVQSARVVAGKSTAAPTADERPVVPDPRLDVDDFGPRWLEQARPGVEWLMPAGDFVPPIPALNVAIKHRPGDTIEARINGERMNPLFFFGTQQNQAGTVARSYWQGIHLKDGANTLQYIVRGRDGKETVLERVVYYSGPPVRAELVEQYSRLIADGRRPPVLAVRFYDRRGRPVRPGLVGEYEVLPPYISRERIESMEQDMLLASDRIKPVYEVGPRGIALIELEPTSQSGQAVLKFAFNGGRQEEVRAWLKPAPRDWIVVGVADATAGKHKVSGDGDGAAAHDFDEDGYDEGRVALFAKGNLNEDWLLTASVDSDREERATGNGLFQTVDPDEYFQLYGDNTEQRYEAPSTEKLYLKLERERFYTLYGDYDTGLGETELSRYNRRVTGLKSEYHGGLFNFTGFATETSHRYVRDDIRGDGTSGLYQLSRGDIVLNSETIVIETRDRFHSEQIVERRNLRRHYDYNIDYQSGTVYFRQPVPARDSNFNPVYIVVEYETQTGIKDDPTYGGRGELSLAGGDFVVGLTGINDGTFGREGELQGMDARYRFGAASTLRMEYADSEALDAGLAQQGSAYLAELNTRGETVDGRVYLREQDGGFGLGQQAGSENATRKYGLEGGYQFTRRWRLNSEVFHEDNLATGAERDVAELDVAYTTGRHNLMTGVRSARDVLGDGTVNESELLLAGAGTALLDNKLQLGLNSEVALDSQNANAAYPTRHIASMEYAWTRNVASFIEHEITEGENQDTYSTRAGVRTIPWARARFDSSVEQRTGEYGPRLFSVMGLTQGFRVDERWSGDVSYDRAETLREPGDIPFNVNTPPPSGTYSDDYTAVSLGATRRGEHSTLVSRFEQRLGEQEDKRGMLLGWNRDLKQGVTYSLDSQWFASEFADGSEAAQGNARFSLAYRPVTSKWMHLNRLEYKLDERTDVLGAEDRTRKVINNWKGNYMPHRDHQIALSYGVKYVLSNFDGAEYDGVTHYAGTEYRYDLNPRWDVGVHADTLYSANADNRRYSYGLSTGWNLAKNLWLSVGYNFDGFRDADFSLANYTAEGPFVKLRVKFDQQTLGLND